MVVVINHDYLSCRCMDGHAFTQTEEEDYQAITLCPVFLPRTRLRSWPPNVKNSKIK